MKYILLPIFFVCISFFNTEAKAQTIANEIIFQTKKPEHRQILREVFNLNQDIDFVQIKTLSHWANISLLVIESHNDTDWTDEAIETLLELDYVNYAYPNSHTSNRATPNDPLLDRQWALERIKAFAAWDITTGGTTPDGTPIVIAVLDDGFDIEHEDLKNVWWTNEREIPNDGKDNDLNGYVDDYKGLDLIKGNDKIVNKSHGTSVAGIVGAETNNDIGVAGLNWNASILPMSSVTNEARVIEAYDYLITLRNQFNNSNGENGAYIVAANYSLGIDKQFGSNHPAWCNMYDKMGEVGILSVGATTNTNTNIDEQGDLPTTCSSQFLISVTNTSPEDLKIPGAGFGSVHIDIGSPGANSYAPKPQNEYGKFGGTSASAPHTAGAIGLLAALPCDALQNLIKANPSEAALRMREAILQGGDALPSLNGITATGKRLNILGAMENLASLCGEDGNSLRGTLSIDKIKRNSTNSYVFEYTTPNIDPVTIDVYDMSGRTVWSTVDQPGILSKSTWTFDPRDLSKGIYIVSISSKEDRISKQFAHF